MKHFIVAILAVTCMLPAEEMHYGSSNFATDMEGDPDTRQGTWGSAGAQEWVITFDPPPDHRVQIEHIHGDLVSWVRWNGASQPGRFAGVLMGIQTTEPDGSTRADWLADNTFLYIQDVCGAEGKRTPFNVRLKRVLPPDHKLRVKVAVWLNDTGRAVHMEPTITIGYRFVSDEEAAQITGDE